MNFKVSNSIFWSDRFPPPDSNRDFAIRAIMNYAFPSIREATAEASKHWDDPATNISSSNSFFSISNLNLQFGQVVSIDSLDRISGKISVQKIELDAMFVLLIQTKTLNFICWMLFYVLRSFSFCLDFPSCNLTEKFEIPFPARASLKSELCLMNNDKER